MSGWGASGEQQQTEFCIKNTNEILTSPNRMLVSERVGSPRTSGEKSGAKLRKKFHKHAHVHYLIMNMHNIVGIGTKTLGFGAGQEQKRMD